MKLVSSHKLEMDNDPETIRLIGKNNMLFIIYCKPRFEIEFHLTLKLVLTNFIPCPGLQKIFYSILLCYVLIGISTSTRVLEYRPTEPSID